MGNDISQTARTVRRSGERKKLSRMRGGDQGQRRGERAEERRGAKKEDEAEEISGGEVQTGIGKEEALQMAGPMGTLHPFECRP